ncbi:alpha/beta fold hydrolase [Marinobacter bohaiensis]|uniref:alpha/beta fold hydrolase n=1 Tax=Marinobacter bohaiensis TaxID=2201898 RepID=UPI000DABDB60|nr:alpha/beta fold hydrolase [Marinobacter bohaiensis]
MSLDLHHRVVGEGDPLIVLHGLFGSLENLGGITQRLSDRWQIHALDLRNHGRSPHTDAMGYPAMADDVKRYMDSAGLATASVLGHSMGGKTAMELALAHPDRIDRLIVADIAPVDYPPHHDAIIDGLSGLDLTAIASRGAADKALAEAVPEAPVRQFLLKNLVRDADGGFTWRLNLDVIERHYDQIAAGPSAEGPFEGPTLFIKGGDSGYIQTQHQDIVARLFPQASLRIIPGTGHWLHAEKPDLFANLCSRFLDGEFDAR